jgi:hypothetical protein
MGASLQIAFGKRRVPGGDTVALSSGHAVIVQGTPAICLNSPGWLTPPPDLIMAMQTRALLRRLCHDGLAALTSGFSAAAQRATRRYLEDLDARFPTPTEPPYSLFHDSDRFFAAMLPMPAPKIAIQQGKILGETRAEADLALWDGQHLTLISFGEEGQYTPRQRQARDDLVALSPVPVRLHAAPLQRDVPLDEIFPADILTWATDAPLPVLGPIRLSAFQIELGSA